MSHAYGCRTRGGTRGDGSNGEQFGGGNGGRASVASHGAAFPRPAAAQVMPFPAAPRFCAVLRAVRGARAEPSAARRFGVRGFPLPESRAEVF